MHTKIQNCFSFWGLQTPYWGFTPGPHLRTSVPRPPAQDVPPHFVPGLRPWLIELWFVKVQIRSVFYDILFCCTFSCHCSELVDSFFHSSN